MSAPVVPVSRCPDGRLRHVRGTAGLQPGGVDGVDHPHRGCEFDDTYHAALDALFDEGYTIEESDKAGGVITGLLRDDRSYERAWINPDLEDIEFRLSILIRAEARTGRRSGTRRSTVNGRSMSGRSTRSGRSCVGRCCSRLRRRRCRRCGSKGERDSL